MTCGCKTLSTFQNSENLVHAAACILCPHADNGRGPYLDGVVSCTIDGSTIHDRLRLKPCPIGRHEQGGVVRWAGVRWYGLPYPIRLWLWLFHPSHPRPKKWPQCGCIKRLKDLLGDSNVTVQRSNEVRQASTFGSSQTVGSPKESGSKKDVVPQEQP